MKRNPAEQAIRDRMQAGALSRDGFLGADTRNLDDIIAADLAVVEEAGLTTDQLADLLDALHAAADEELERPVALAAGRVTAQLTEVMGRIPCPFACGHRSHKAVIEVRFGNKLLMVTPLNAHLIRAHGFFQGKGASFRLEPADLVALYGSGVLTGSDPGPTAP